MIDWEAFYNSFRAPDFISGYEIQNRLGGGAFGDVYKARKRSIGKIYAIKFLKLDEATQRDVVERELEQVRLFASIDHPHLVTIEDMGVVMEVPYLVMGYAGEDTLARRLTRDDLDRDAALSYFVQACRGVLALHDRRLAHFDLKPSNVFIKGEVARVGDYGLAKLLADGRQTLSFGRGTPHYMAPEMLKNRADHRADIYSLGVILFESLAGAVPFPAESGFGGLLREDDGPPTFPPDFPVELRHVVETALRIDPDHRYANLTDLLTDLGQSARQGESIHLPWGDAPPPRRPAPDPARADAPRRTAREDEETPARSELRVAAQELVRGAVEVARGVWDGVSGNEDAAKRGDGAKKGAAPESPRKRTERDDIVSLKTIDEPDARPAERGPLRAAPAKRGVLERTPATVAASDGSWPGGGEPSVAAAGASGVGAHTVPVPPRAAGGVIGTLLSSAALGLEVMIALVTGPVLFVLRSGGRFVDRGVRFLPGALGRLFRFALLLVLLAAAGGFLAFVAVTAMSQAW